MLKKDISLLRCPYCGFSFHIHLEVEGDAKNIEYGTVYCRCDEFPIVYGILYLHKKRHKHIVSSLQSGNTAQALRYALPRYAQYVVTPTIVGSVGLAGIQMIIGFINNLTYYINRQRESESLLIFYPYMVVARQVKGKACVWLDIGSGIKHYYRALRKLHTRLQIISLEQSFLNIFLSRAIDPEKQKTMHICVDAGVGMCLKPKSADIVTCHDAFPFIARQKAVASYCTTMVKRTGIVSFASIPEHQYLSFRSAVNPIHRSLLKSYFPTPPTFIHEANLLSMMGQKTIDFSKVFIHDHDPVFRYMCMWPQVKKDAVYTNVIPKHFIQGKLPPWTKGPKFWQNIVY